MNRTGASRYTGMELAVLPPSQAICAQDVVEPDSGTSDWHSLAACSGSLRS